MSKAKTFDAVAQWDGETLTVRDSEGRAAGTDLGSLRGKSVVVLLSRRATQVRATELPPASAEDLRQLVRLKLGDLFPSGPGELAYAVAARHNADLPGLTPIFAARISDLTEIHGAARVGGFRVVSVLPEAAGSALLAHELDLDDALVATPDAAGLGLDIVRGGETTLSRPTPPGASIESEIRRTLLAANTGSLPIVAAGGMGVGIPFADRSTERSPVRALLEAPDRWDGLDLIPDDLRARRQADLRRSRLRQGGMILAASVLVLAYVLNSRSGRAAEIERLQRRYNAEVKRYQQVLDLSAGKSAKLDPQAKLLERGFSPAQKTSDVAYLIPSLLPNGVWISSIIVEKGKVVQIRGVALASEGVSTFLKNLGTQKRLRDVKLSFATVGEIETKPVVNFSISAFPVGNLPLEEPKKTTRTAAPRPAAPNSSTGATAQR